MNSAAGIISLQIAHLQNFVNNSLAGYRCIAMNQYRKNFIIITFVHHIRLALEKPTTTGSTASRCEGFGINFKCIVLPSGVCNFTAKTHVIFYITAAHCLIQFCSSFKFTEYLLICFSHDICKHI